MKFYRIPIGIAIVISFLLLPFQAANAHPLYPEDLPPLPLPPVPTPPTPEVPEETVKVVKINGARIALYIEEVPSNVWTLMQWQDYAGEWHTIQGWQGTPDFDGQKIWWLPEELKGKGPFRWIVTDGEGGRWRGISEPFYLPDVTGTTKEIRVNHLQ